MSDLGSNSVISITGQVSDRTPNFTGRTWVFQSIHQWLSNPNSSRYFLLTGEPGAGKTAISDRLTRFSHNPDPPDPNLPPGFLNAVHRCSARDSTSIDPKTFARAIALQLAQKIPPFAQALKDIGEKQVNIQVDLSIETANHSTLQGIIIQNLDLSGVMTAEETFNWVVVNPLKTIYQNGFDQPTIILIDALDEALTHSGDRTIVDLLSTLESLPAQVRFILTSRKVAQVENKLGNAQELNLSTPEFNTYNRADIQAYIQNRISQENPISTQLSTLDPHQQEDAIKQITQKSDGNFLYVQFLLDAIDRGERSPTNLEGLPEGLDGLYYESLERMISLGKQDWRTTYAQIIGILSVAHTSITLTQLQAFTRLPESTLHQCLGDLRQFLEEMEPQSATETESSYSLYHQSVVDFLRVKSFKQRNNTRHNSYYIPAQETHQQITNHYWPPSQDLETLDLKHLDSYAYTYLTYHLLESDRKNNLYELLIASPKWMEAKFIHCNGDASYAADLDLAINTFSDPLTASQLTVLIQLHTVHQVIAQRINRYDDIDLRTLVVLERETEALNHAQLRFNTQTRFRGLVILYDLLERKGHQLCPSLLQDLQKIADSIEEPRLQISALGTVAYRLDQVGRKGEAEAIFTQARKLAYQIDNKSMKSLVLTKLADSLTYAEYFPEAEEITRTIDDPERQACSLAELAASLAQANQLEKSKALFSEAQKLALALPDGHDKESVLKALSTALIEAKDLDAAKQVTLTIRNHRKRAEALSELGIALVKDEQETQVKAIFSEAETLARSSSDEIDRGAALKVLAHALAQTKQYAEAERVALSIEVDWAKTEALAELSAALAQTKQFTEAQRIAEMIQDKGGKAFALRVLAMANARMGDSAAATHFFHEAGAIAPVIEDQEISIFALVLLAISLKKAGYEPQAEKVFKEVLKATQSIQNDMSQISTFKNIVAELANQCIFPESENFAQAIQDPFDRFLALKEIAISLARNNYKAESIKIFAEIEKLVDSMKDDQIEDLDRWRQYSLLPWLSKTLAHVKYFTEAERIALKVDDSWQAEVFAELSKALAQDKQFSEAKRIAKAIPEKDWRRVEFLCSIAVATTHSEIEETAATLLAEAKQLAESIEDSSSKTLALRALAKAFIQIKQFTEAETIAYAIEEKEQQAWTLQELAIASEEFKHYTAAVKAVKLNISGFERVGILQNLAAMMAKLGKEDEANKLLADAENAVRSEDIQYQARLLTELAISHAQSGHFFESQRIIENIDHWMERDKALLVLAREFNKVGQFSDAKRLIQMVRDEKKQRWAFRAIVIALMQQKLFAEAFKELETQTPDNFVHILASSALIFNELETNLSLVVLKHVVRIVGWVRPDWRNIDSILVF